MSTQPYGRVESEIAWCLLALGLVTTLLGCIDSPRPCDHELVFDSMRDGSSEIYSMNLDSLTIRQITDSAESEVANRFPDWSPDGQEIVFVSEDDTGLGDLYVADAMGSANRKLTNESARYENPAWSSEGDWIAFVKGLEEDWGLYLVRPDGTDLRRIDGPNLFHPSWSPGGERLAVVTGGESDWYGAVLRLDGGDPQRFTPEGLIVGSVTWSPDGTRIAFDAVAADNFDLYVVDVDGLFSNLQRLTKSAAIDARPEWSPDGKKLVFHSTRDFGSVHGEERWEDFELYLFDLANREIRRLTRNEVFDAHPDWCDPTR